MRVKEGMSLRNGMWHDLRNDIIMRNLIYTGKHARASVCFFWCQFERAMDLMVHLLLLLKQG